MAEKTRVICVGEVMIELVARRRQPLRPLVRRRHVQHRGLSRARRHSGGLRERDGRRSLLGRAALARRRRRRERGSHRARARPHARALPDRDRREGRAQVLLLARHLAGARPVRIAELGGDRRGAARRAARLFLRRHALALFQHRARPLPRRARARAQAGRDGCVRRQFPSARLEGRRGAHAHGVRRGAQARRHRAPDVRGRGDAVGRCQPRCDGRAAAGLRHRRDRGEERLEHGAGRRQVRPRARAGARRWSSRSTRRRRGIRSMRPIWRRGSRARARCRQQAPRTALPRR